MNIPWVYNQVVYQGMINNSIIILILVQFSSETSELDAQQQYKEDTEEHFHECFWNMKQPT